MKGKRLRRLAAVLLLAAFAVSGGYLVYKNLDYRRGAQEYAAAADIAAVPVLPEVLPAEEEEVREIPEELLDSLAEVDLGALREVNGEVVG